MLQSARRAKAFTLIELMMVVSIVGILSTLAIYGVRKYIANAKTTEARNGVGRLAQDAAMAFETEKAAAGTMGTSTSTGYLRGLCATGVQASVPTSVASVQGRKYQSSRADWNLAADVASKSGFPCLKFQMDAAQYYQYSYTGQRSGAGGLSSQTGDVFLASANGDLNGDGIISTFSLSGVVNTGYILNTAPSIRETLPDE